MANLPAFGRDIIVATPVLGDEKKLGLIRRYLVAVDDDKKAKDLVMEREDFAPKDDQPVLVNPNVVPRDVLERYDISKHGEVKKIEDW